MELPVHMESVPELKFPANVFSPLAASSPKLTKMRAPKRDQSWISSDESSGNVTAQAITGVDESHMDASKMHESTYSLHTAIEYVDAELLQGRSFEHVLTREELQSAIFEEMKKGFGVDYARLYSLVTTERILWSQCRTWIGTIFLQKKEDVNSYVDYACTDWYLKNTAQVCMDELTQINELGRYDYVSVGTYCYEKGVPAAVSERIFAKNLVRRTNGDCLSKMEVLWLLFAMIGTDESQSFEYWFRVLDEESSGMLELSILHKFYDGITEYLAERNVTSLPFDNVINQFRDILGTDTWTLRAFKKEPMLAGRVINGFVNAYRFLEQELDEKMNGERVDDESFGEGPRTRWQRMIDHEFDRFYQPEDSSSSPENTTFTRA